MVEVVHQEEATRVEVVQLEAQVEVQTRVVLTKIKANEEENNVFFKA